MDKNGELRMIECGNINIDDCRWKLSRFIEFYGRIGMKNKLDKLVINRWLGLVFEWACRNRKWTIWINNDWSGFLDNKC